MIKVFVRTDKGNSVPPRLIDEHTSVELFLRDVGLPLTPATQVMVNGSAVTFDQCSESIRDLTDQEEVTILLCEKQQLGADLKIMGHAIAVTSEFSVEEIADAEASNPELLTLRDSETKDPLFKVTVASEDSTETWGSIGKYGVTFSPYNNIQGKAVVTALLNQDYFENPSPQQIRMDLVKQYGGVIANLNKIEDQLKDNIEALKQTAEALENSISFVG